MEYNLELLVTVYMSVAILGLACYKLLEGGSGC